MTGPTAAEIRSFVLGHVSAGLAENGLVPSELDDGADLFAMGVIDSIGVLELIAAVSDRYGIDGEWEDYEPEDFVVLGPFCRYVAAHARRDGPAGP